MLQAFLKKLLLFVGLLVVFTSVALAQQSRTLFFMHDLPQSSYVNPAIQPSCRWFIGIPALNSLYVNATSTGFAYKDISDGIIDVERFSQNLRSMNYFTTELHLNLVSIGHRRKDFYYSFNIAEKVDLKVFYTQSLVKFLATGNDDGTHQDINFSLGANALHYREYSIGIAQNFESFYFWGVRGKLLFGKSNLTNKNGVVQLTSSPNIEDNHEIGANWTYQFNGSFPIVVPQDTGAIDLGRIKLAEIDPLGYLLNPKNFGFAVDFGVVYIYEPFTFAASVIDFGLFRWSSDAHRFYNTGNFSFKGVTIEDALNSEGFVQRVTTYIEDQLEVRHKQENYYTLLPTKINIGMAYEFLPKLNIATLFRTEFYPHRPLPSFSLSLNTNQIKNMSASVSYSIMNNSYNNIGFGLGFGFQNFMIHAVSDNVLAFINPQNTHTANLRFGMHLLFGCKDRSKEFKYTGPGCYWLPGGIKK